ncbi:unnamed protein product [Vitrella brassicaformis CCMP3155]|uniref:Uncharacterized protein n=4 Tax=Vitrella brassicaformis TaxID=1169539 RepID=A0A0G4ECD9_VITBC|nr:unnamed protein product [Vitrella brassicaformis CCMP3155]|eukprot:CEL93372.1 unnamed protein product [Vitrella brassicaformis CCMP3155]
MSRRYFIKGQAFDSCAAAATEKIKEVDAALKELGDPPQPSDDAAHSQAIRESRKALIELFNEVVRLAVSEDNDMKPDQALELLHRAIVMEGGQQRHRVIYATLCEALTVTGWAVKPVTDNKGKTVEPETGEWRRYKTLINGITDRAIVPAAVKGELVDSSLIDLLKGRAAKPRLGTSPTHIYSLFRESTEGYARIIDLMENAIKPPAMSQSHTSPAEGGLKDPVCVESLFGQLVVISSFFDLCSKRILAILLTYLEASLDAAAGVADGQVVALLTLMAAFPKTLITDCVCFHLAHQQHLSPASLFLRHLANRIRKIRAKRERASRGDDASAKKDNGSDKGEEGAIKEDTQTDDTKDAAWPDYDGRRPLPHVLVPPTESFFTAVALLISNGLADLERIYPFLDPPDHHLHLLHHLVMYLYAKEEEQYSFSTTGAPSDRNYRLSAELKPDASRRTADAVRAATGGRGPGMVRLHQGQGQDDSSRPSPAPLRSMGKGVYTSRIPTPFSKGSPSSRHDTADTEAMPLTRNPDDSWPAPPRALVAADKTSGHQGDLTRCLPINLADATFPHPEQQKGGGGGGQQSKQAEERPRSDHPDRYMRLEGEVGLHRSFVKDDRHKGPVAMMKDVASTSSGGGDKTGVREESKIEEELSLDVKLLQSLKYEELPLDYNYCEMLAFVNALHSTKLRLIAALIDINAWPLAEAMIHQLTQPVDGSPPEAPPLFPAFMPLMHHAIRSSFFRLMRWVIDPLYQQIHPLRDINPLANRQPRGPRKQGKSLHEYGLQPPVKVPSWSPFSNVTQDEAMGDDSMVQGVRQCEKWEDLAGVLPMLYHAGYLLHGDASLLTMVNGVLLKGVELEGSGKTEDGDTVMGGAADGGPQAPLFELLEPLLLHVLMPAMTYLPANSMVSEGIWELLKCLSTDRRYAVYADLMKAYTEFPLSIQWHGTSKMATSLFKRIVAKQQSAARQSGGPSGGMQLMSMGGAAADAMDVDLDIGPRTSAHTSKNLHNLFYRYCVCNPFPVFTLANKQVKMAPNIIPHLVETTKTVTDFSADAAVFILTFLRLESGEGRDGLLEECEAAGLKMPQGTAFPAIFEWNAKFLRKHPNVDIFPLLVCIIQKLAENDVSLERLLVQEVLKYMGGIPFVEHTSLNAEQIRAQAGGPLLRFHALQTHRDGLPSDAENKEVARLLRKGKEALLRALNKSQLHLNNASRAASADSGAAAVGAVSSTRKRPFDEVEAAVATEISTDGKLVVPLIYTLAGQLSGAFWPSAKQHLTARLSSDKRYADYVRKADQVLRTLGGLGDDAHMCLQGLCEFLADNTNVNAHPMLPHQQPQPHPHPQHTHKGGQQAKVRAGKRGSGAAFETDYAELCPTFGRLLAYMEVEEAFRVVRPSLPPYPLVDKHDSMEVDGSLAQKKRDDGEAVLEGIGAMVGAHFAAEQAAPASSVPPAADAAPTQDRSKRRKTDAQHEEQQPQAKSGKRKAEGEADSPPPPKKTSQAADSTTGDGDKDMVAGAFPRPWLAMRGQLLAWRKEEGCVRRGGVGGGWLEGFTMDLYLTFWRLDWSDMLVPKDVYDATLQQIETNIKEVHRRRDALLQDKRDRYGRAPDREEDVRRDIRVLEKEVERLKTSKQELQAEFDRLVTNQQHVTERIDHDKINFFTAPTNASLDASAQEGACAYLHASPHYLHPAVCVVKYLLAPRIKCSTGDAMFGWEFMTRLVEARTPNLYFFPLVEACVKTMPPLIRGMTDSEAWSCGSLFNKIFTTLTEWQRAPNKYVKEFDENPCLSIFQAQLVARSTDPPPASEAPGPATESATPTLAPQPLGEKLLVLLMHFEEEIFTFFFTMVRQALDGSDGPLEAAADGDKGDDDSKMDEEEAAAEKERQQERVKRNKENAYQEVKRGLAFLVQAAPAFPCTQFVATELRKLMDQLGAHAAKDRMDWPDVRSNANGYAYQKLRHDAPRLDVGDHAAHQSLKAWLKAQERAPPPESSPKQPSPAASPPRPLPPPPPKNLLDVGPPPRTQPSAAPAQRPPTQQTLPPSRPAPAPAKPLAASVADSGAPSRAPQAPRAAANALAAPAASSEPKAKSPPPKATAPPTKAPAGAAAAAAPTVRPPSTQPPQEKQPQQQQEPSARPKAASVPSPKPPPSKSPPPSGPSAAAAAAPKAASTSPRPPSTSPKTGGIVLGPKATSKSPPARSPTSTPTPQLRPKPTSTPPKQPTGQPPSSPPVKPSAAAKPAADLKAEEHLAQKKEAVREQMASSRAALSPRPSSAKETPSAAAKPGAKADGVSKAPRAASPVPSGGTGRAPGARRDGPSAPPPSSAGPASQAGPDRAAKGAASPPSSQNGRVKESQEGPRKGDAAAAASAASSQHEKSPVRSDRGSERGSDRRATPKATAPGGRPRNALNSLDSPAPAPGGSSRLASGGGGAPNGPSSSRQSERRKEGPPPPEPVSTRSMRSDAYGPRGEGARGDGHYTRGSVTQGLSSGDWRDSRGDDWRGDRGGYREKDSRERRQQHSHYPQQHEKPRSFYETRRRS